jgi:hypothetical protein
MKNILVFPDETPQFEINDWDVIPNLGETVIMNNIVYKIVQVINNYDDNTIKYILA